MNIIKLATQLTNSFVGKKNHNFLFHISNIMMFTSEKAQIPIRLNRPLFTEISMNQTARAAPKKVNSSSSNRQLNKTRQQYRRLPTLRTKRRSCEFSLQNECSSDYDSYIRSDKYKLSFEPGIKKENYTADDLIHISKDRLVNLRGTYDETLAQTEKILSAAAEIRKEILQLRRQYEDEGDSNDYFKTRLKNIKNSMQICQEKQQQVIAHKKTLEHILRRMQKDKIFYEQKGYILEIEAKNHMKNQNIGLKTNLKAESENYQYQTIYKNIRKDYTKYKEFRAKKLNQFTHTLKRHKEFSDSCLDTRSFVDFKKNQTRQLYLVHNFLERMLRDKASKLRHDYKPLEVCFDQIRRSVTLSDNDIIADKFFAQSEIFETVKETVHSLQDKLRIAQHRHEELQSEFQRLSSGPNNLSEEATHSECINLPCLNSSAPRQDYRLQSIYFWAVQKLKVFQTTKCNFPLRKQMSIRQSKTQTEEKPHTVEQTAQKFIQLCSRITDSLKIQLSQTTREAKFKRFSTTGISIKKQIRLLTADEERQKITERQTAIEINSSEQDWISRLRKQVKSNRQNNSLEKECPPRSPYRKLNNR